MIATKDYSTKMNSEVKYTLLAQLFRIGYDKDGVYAYIKKNFVRFITCIIETWDIDTIKLIIQNGTLVTKKNIDKLLQIAKEAKQRKIVNLLSKEKN